MSRADDLILIGATGVASIAPLGTTAPTTASAALTGFTDLGGITTDGLEEAFNDTIATEAAWGSRGPVVTLYSGSDRTYKFTCLETNPKVLEVFFRQASPLTPVDSVVSFDDKEATNVLYYAGVFDVAMNATNLARFYFKKIALTGRGTVTYKEDGSANYEFTVTVYRDSVGSVGKRWYDLSGLDVESDSSSS